MMKHIVSKTNCERAIIAVVSPWNCPLHLQQAQCIRSFSSSYTVLLMVLLYIFRHKNYVLIHSNTAIITYRVEYPITRKMQKKWFWFVGFFFSRGGKVLHSCQYSQRYHIHICMLGHHEWYLLHPYSCKASSSTVTLHIRASSTNACCASSAMTHLAIQRPPRSLRSIHGWPWPRGYPLHARDTVAIDRTGRSLCSISSELLTIEHLGNVLIQGRSKGEMSAWVLQHHQTTNINVWCNRLYRLNPQRK